MTLTATTTNLMIHSTTGNANRAYIGGAISLTAGLVLGTTRLLGFNTARVFTKQVAASVADWMYMVSHHRTQFPRLLVDTAASHSNRPLEHLKLLNNAPISVVSSLAAAKRSQLLFVHSA
ncbi:predicted protein [Lichtheimia corymbifera JMRC:FSU:9682]|uniref:Uncharacterized protein n=2 Tax=Lichtheimia TaxID=688353 RepID=A0A068S861_9FUNG|nr:uncharacterized protein O0I10_008756 [Lichtheimia ornata]KAJ8655470.1 hypothetical protein O0I10_008756 [Lichtheimia ornata]CDH58474.1 predicted protein [Lichtheimia corymbifera JMRC:FSU:9682]